MLYNLKEKINLHIIIKKYEKQDKSGYFSKNEKSI